MKNNLPPLGLWIDCPPRRVQKPEYFDQLQRLGVTTAAIMVERNAPRWDPFWSMAELEAVGQLAIERDMEIVLTTWPVPRKGELDRMCSDMIGMLMCGAVAWEVDCEGLWKKGHVRDFRSLAEAGDYLSSLMRRITSRVDVRTELTTHPGHAESGPKAKLAPTLDRFLCQAYSVRHRPGGKEIGWGNKYGPGRMQEAALTRAELIPDEPMVGAGLAAWDQQWPGHTVAEAMFAALESALRFDPCEIRYWSSKWVMRDATVATFLAEHWGV